MRVHRHVLFAILLTAGCAKAPPAVVTSPPVDPVKQLQEDLAAATKLAGVQRATWGIAVQSLARNGNAVLANRGDEPGSATVDVMAFNDTMTAIDAAK